jgi:quinol monooxygenase YgiN
LPCRVSVLDYEHTNRFDAQTNSRLTAFWLDSPAHLRDRNYRGPVGGFVWLSEHARRVGIGHQRVNYFASLSQVHAILLTTTARTKEAVVVIVAGHIVVDPSQRENYLSGCVEVVRQARRAPGCLDFSLSADLVEPGRVNIFERWESQAAVEAFRGSGPSDEQGAAIVSAAVAEYDVGGQRSLS